jgi:hypothetical protein
MTEHVMELTSNRSAHSLFKVYLDLDTEQKKSVASTLETGSQYQGQDDKVLQFLQLGDLVPDQKDRLCKQIAEDITHR